MINGDHYFDRLVYICKVVCVDFEDVVDAIEVDNLVNLLGVELGLGLRDDESVEVD